MLTLGLCRGNTRYEWPILSSSCLLSAPCGLIMLMVSLWPVGVDLQRTLRLPRWWQLPEFTVSVGFTAGQHTQPTWKTLLSIYISAGCVGWGETTVSLISGQRPHRIWVGIIVFSWLVWQFEGHTFTSKLLKKCFKLYTFCDFMVYVNKTKTSFWTVCRRLMYLDNEF